MKKGQEIEVEIEKLAYGGKGVARVNNRVVFVDGALPGDRAIVRIRRKKKNFAEATVKQIIQPSSLRTEPRCKHFGVCGGCKWQNMSYEDQIRVKAELVRESLEHLAGLEAPRVLATLPSPLVYGYRNKMEFSFTERRWLTAEELADPQQKKDFALGFHVPGAFDRVMHIETCWLQDETMNGILNFSQRYFRDSGIPVFDLKTHQGQLRFLVLRKSFHYQKYMVNIVTFRPALEELQDFSHRIVKEFPQISSVINVVNRKFAQIAFGEEEYLLFGTPTLQEKLGRFVFEISANSFFQTNPLQAEKLYATVEDFVGENNLLIWDLYSGTGTIALFLSPHTQKVVGFELVESAVEDARKNSARNGIDNCEFVPGDIRDNIHRRKDQPDVVVCDPPRSGIHPDILRELIRIAPRKVVYVSCNPTTMARDIKILAPYYQVELVQPVDMFPHTYHIESVAKLVRR